MDWTDIKADLSKAAPIMGTLIGGPAGAAIGALASAALGVANTPDAVAAAIATDPMAAEKLKEAEMDSKVQLQQLVVQARQNELAAENSQYAAEAADRDSARKMAATKPEDWWVRPLVVVLLLIGSMAIVGFVFIPGTREAMQDANTAGIIGVVFGYWFSELKVALAFYFGATKDAADSARKMANFAVAPGTVTLDDTAPAPAAK